MPVYEMQDQTYSFGSEYKKVLTESSTLTIGASYDIEKALKADNSNTNGASYVYKDTLGNTVSGFSGNSFALGDSKSFNPMIKLDTKVDDTLSLYGGVDKKSRIPSIKDRYSFRLGFFVPNPNLVAETTINYEIGAVKKFTDGFAKCSIFYANVDNFIQSQYVNIYKTSVSPANQQQQLQNIGNISQKGLELDGSYNVNESLSFDGSYTKLLMKNESNPSILIADVPKDKVVLTSNYTPIKAVSWINSLEYDSGRLDQIGTPYYSSGVETEWNTKIAYRATKALSFEVGINNVLDRNYYLAYGYPEAGRVYYGNVRYKF